MKLFRSGPQLQTTQRIAQWHCVTVLGIAVLVSTGAATGKSKTSIVPSPLEVSDFYHGKSQRLNGFDLPAPQRHPFITRDEISRDPNQGPTKGLRLSDKMYETIDNENSKRFPGTPRPIKSGDTAPQFTPIIPSGNGSRPSALLDQPVEPNHSRSHAEIHQFTEGYRDQLHGVDTPEPYLNDGDAPIVIPPRGPIKGPTNRQLFRHEIKSPSQVQLGTPTNKNRGQIHSATPTK
jgi:hypothetical protein